MSVEPRALGAGVPVVAPLGLGTLHFGLRLDEARATRLVHRALDLGVTFFDTGPLYGEGRAEGILGRALAGRRDGCVVATKVGLAPAPLPGGAWGVRPERLTREVIEASVDRSLASLGGERIDLLQLHAFDPETPPAETAAALSALVLEGKVAAIGCSNYDPGELRSMTTALAAEGLRFASCQVHYNMLERRAGEALAPQGVPLVCNRALARGILGGRYRSGELPPEDSRAASSDRVRRWLSVDTVELVAALGEFAAARGRTVPQLALAWALAQPGVAVALVGVRGEDQLLECVQGAEWRLADGEAAAIDAIIAARGLTRQVHALPEDFFER